MDRSCGRSHCNGTSFDLSEKSRTRKNVCEIFLSNYASVVVGAAAAVHSVTEIPFRVVKTVSDIVARVVDSVTDIAWKIVDVVLNAVMIFALISICVVNDGCVFVTVMITEIAVIAAVDVSSACTRRHARHYRDQRKSEYYFLHLFASQKFLREDPEISI